MYREEGWMKGHYIDNHMKHQCRNCGKEFIVGEKLLTDCPPGFPLCPYCGHPNAELMSWTENDALQQLESDLGCLAIHFDTEYNYYTEQLQDYWKAL